MKILTVKVVGSEARFVFEEFPTSTFVVDLRGKTGQQEIIEELRTRFNAKQKLPVNDWSVVGLVGTDIDA